MRHNLNFILAVNKLKEIPRTGWVLREVKNAETIAEHTFGMATLAWIMAEKRKLNVKRAIKIALFHDICEVYAGDITPYLYYPNLPVNREKRKKMLMRWIRLSQKEKHKRGRFKFNKEKEGLLKLTKNLAPGLRKEIISLWACYEKGVTNEGKFVNQLNRIETLIQSIDYFGTKGVKYGTNWWEWTEEIVEDPLLLKFLKVIQKKFYGQVVGDYERDEEMENTLEFIVNIGKLKKLERKYWLAHGIKKPETVAGHIFTVVLLAWLLGQEKKNLNMGKIIKMALCHEIYAVYTGDTIPYILRLPKDISAPALQLSLPGEPVSLYLHKRFIPSIGSKFMQ
jgi:putative hydrolase of HD superfamily